MRKFLASTTIALALAAGPAMAQSTVTSTPITVGSGSNCFWFEGSSRGITTVYGIQYPAANSSSDVNTLLKIAGWRETVLAHPFGTVTGALAGTGQCDGEPNIQFLIAITSP